MPVEVYRFDDYRAYLHAWQDERRGRTQRFLAEQLGCSTALVSSFLNPTAKHPRQIPDALMEPLCALLELDDHRAAYFRDLVARDHARTPAEREAAFERTLAAREYHGALTLSDDDYRFFSRWYYMATLELVDCRNFDDDPVVLASRLRPRVSVEQAAEALDVLKRMELIVQAPDGRWRPNARLVVDDQDISRERREQATKAFHRWLLARGSEVMDTVPRGDKVLNGITFAIARDKVPEVRRRIEEFLRQMLHFAAADEVPRDRVMQVALQMYPLADVDPPADQPGGG